MNIPQNNEQCTLPKICLISGLIVDLYLHIRRKFAKIVDS